ncbi:hypothetical protein HBH51_078550 [Parastagonospora nodorum]|nr:hypothetical protein HBH51_078550 [Parastagonospora nodorum]
MAAATTGRFAHLLSSVHCTLVCRYAPPLPAIHSPIIDVFTLPTVSMTCPGYGEVEPLAKKWWNGWHSRVEERRERD